MKYASDLSDFPDLLRAAADWKKQRTATRASPHEVGINLRPNKLRIHRESTRLDRHKNVILIVTNCGKNPA
jgi:hypothetical protein